MEGIAAQAAQVLEGLEKRREMGIYPPDYVVEMARGAMLGQLRLNAPTYDRVDPTRIDIYTRFADDTEALVVEMGMRGFGEIARLCEIAAPTIGVVTAVAWGATLAAGATWLVLYLATRVVSVASLAAAAALPTPGSMMQNSSPP